MEELTAKLVELIEKGEAATGAYVPVLTEHWVWYIQIRSVGLAIGGVIFLCVSFYFLIKLCKQQTYSSSTCGDPSAQTGVNFLVTAVSGLIGLVLFFSNVFRAIEPVGYLVHRFAT